MICRLLVQIVRTLEEPRYHAVDLDRRQKQQGHELLDRTVDQMRYEMYATRLS